MTANVLDLFAGPGGWDEGVRALDLRPVGVEWDADACATAVAAGHVRFQHDVAALDPGRFAAQVFDGDVDGLIGSPPCQGFSAAGSRRGHGDLAALIDLARQWDDRALATATLDDPRSALALEPLRWALALRPRWMAWEQVPDVLPLWEACRVTLERHGWSVRTGVLRAEDYMVPQARRRAFLVASLDGPAELPAPIGPAVSMSEALGWAPEDRVGFPRRDDTPSNRASENVVEIGGVRYRGRDLFPTSRPAPTVTSKARSWKRWTPSTGELHRVTEAEASVLQSFPADYPWHGSRTARFLQVANAVPPLLARAVVAEVATIQTNESEHVA